MKMALNSLNEGIRCVAISMCIYLVGANFSRRIMALNLIGTIFKDGVLNIDEKSECLKRSLKFICKCCLFFKLCFGTKLDLIVSWTKKPESCYLDVWTILFNSVKRKPFIFFASSTSVMILSVFIFFAYSSFKYGFKIYIFVIHVILCHIFTFRILMNLFLRRRQWSIQWEHTTLYLLVIDYVTFPI